MISVDAFVYAALFVTMAVLVSLALYQRFKNSRDLLHLTASLSCASIGYFFLWLFYANQLSGQYSEAEIVVSLIALNWANYFIYLHYASLVSLNPTHGGRHQLVISVMIAATIIKFFKFIGYLDSFPLILFFCAAAFVGVLTFSLVLPIVIRNYRTLKNKGAFLDVMAIALILLGALSYAYGGISAAIVGQTDIQHVDSFTGGFFNLCGIFCMLFNYFRFNYVYQPVKPIDALILYSETGKTLYSYVSPTLLSFNDSIQDLIRKLYSTIDTLVKHLIHLKSKVELIQTRNYKILFAQTSENITFCVISSDLTYFLKKSIERFLKLLYIDCAIPSPKTLELPLSTRIIRLIDKSFFHFIGRTANLNPGGTRCVIQ